MISAVSLSFILACMLPPAIWHNIQLCCVQQLYIQKLLKYPVSVSIVKFLSPESQSETSDSDLSIIVANCFCETSLLMQGTTNFGRYQHSVAYFGHLVLIYVCEHLSGERLFTFLRSVIHFKVFTVYSSVFAYLDASLSRMPALILEAIYFICSALALR